MKKEAIPQERKEISYSAEERKSKKVGINTFDPMQAKDRAVTYEKINETDH